MQHSYQSQLALAHSGLISTLASILVAKKVMTSEELALHLDNLAKMLAQFPEAAGHVDALKRQVQEMERQLQQRP